MPNQKRKNFFLQLNLALAFLEGLLVLWSFLKEPSEPQSAVFFGFSYFRLALIVTVLAFSAVFVILFINSFRDAWQNRSRMFLTWVAHQNWTAWVFILWIAAVYILLSLSEQRLGTLASYRERLSPILLWWTALSVQFGLVILYQRGIHPEALHDRRNTLLLSLAIFIAFGLVVSIIKLTGVGLTPDRVYWQGPGVPILLPQVLLAALAGLLFYFFIEGTRLGQSARLDRVVFFALWVLTVVIWLNQPAHVTYFSLAPAEPNFQTYPFSDAILYDSTAQEFLIGKPIPGDFWVKPFYSLFLACLHLFAGNNYAFLGSLQVTILAIIPPFVYLLTTSLDRRAAGIVAALLILIRERNAMALANVIQVSHSKLLLSDAFALGEMIILVWLILWWLQRPAERRAAPIAVGGMLGLLVLTRGHPILIFPFILLVSFLVLKPNFKLWSESSVRIALGIALVLIPWFWHVYQLTGKPGFQDPSSRYAKGDWLVQMYAPNSNSGIDVNSEDSPSYGSFQSQVFQLLIERPREVAGFVSAHYFHNVIFSYIYLPSSFQIEDLRSYVGRMPFWGTWNGTLPSGAGVLLVLNLAILALGVGVSWKKANGLIFIPLILGSAYNLSLAVSRRSGWRFLLPADWVTLVFYSIGLIEFVIMIRAMIEQTPVPSMDQESAAGQPSLPVSTKRSLVMSSLPFLLIAILIVQGHQLFPQRYPPKSTSELLRDYQSVVSANPETAALESFLQIDGAIILYGRALYPLYMKAGDGMYNYYWLSYSDRPYDRLAFYVIGPQSMSVVLPMETPPTRFPDGSDVIVIGCQAASGEVIASSVLIQGDAPIQYLSEPSRALTCPLSTP